MLLLTLLELKLVDYPSHNESLIIFENLAFSQLLRKMDRKSNFRGTLNVSNGLKELSILVKKQPKEPFLMDCLTIF